MNAADFAKITALDAIQHLDMAREDVTKTAVRKRWAKGELKMLPNDEMPSDPPIVNSPDVVTYGKAWDRWLNIDADIAVAADLTNENIID